MIEYDYTVKRQMGTTIKEYHPGFPRQIENVAKLRGRNGSGKSTLLSLIALSCYGLDEKVNIIEELKEDMRDLFASDDCEFDFYLKVTDDKKRELRINSYRKGPMFEGRGIDSGIIVKEIIGGKESLLTAEQFVRKYRLIYDMPKDPTGRIKKLIEGVENSHKRYQTEIKDLAKEASTIIRHIKKTSDPEEINREKQKLEKLKKERDDAIEDQKKHESLVRRLKKYKAAIDVQDTKRCYDQAKDDLKKAKQESNKRDKFDREAEKKYKDSEMAISVATINFNRDLQDVSSSIRDIKEIHQSDRDVWFNTVKSMSTDKLSLNKLVSLTQQAIKIKDMLGKEISRLNMDKEEKTQKIIKKLLSLLEEYKKEDLSILGDKIGVIYEELEDESEQTGKKLEYSNELKIAKGNLDDFIYSAGILDTKYRNRAPKPAMDNTDVVPIENLSDEEKLAEKKFKSALLSASEFGITTENFLIIIGEMKLDIDLSDHLMMPLAVLQNEIDNIKTTLQTKNNDIEGSNGYIARIAVLENRIGSMESNELPSLFDYKGELDELESVLQNMQSDLEKKIALLRKISRGEASKGDIERENRYYELVCKNLAIGLKHVSHAGEIYSISSVDLVGKKLITTDGSTEIPFKMMGTGESQNMHLRSQLDSNDGRCVIALFDEVGLMDSNMINDINKKFSSMYDSGDLLIGWMAAPGDKSEVE